MVLLVGNCQLHRLQYVMDVQGFGGYEYLTNTPAMGLPFEPDRVLERIAGAGTVVAQAVMNEAHPLSYDALRALNPNILFVPYVFIDGIFSLSSVGPLGSYAYGQDRVDARVAREGATASMQAVREGAVDFGNVERFAGSIAELKRREAVCGAVQVSDYILETYQLQCPVTTHNHPAPAVFDQFCGQVFRALGVPYRAKASSSHAEQVVYAFSQTPRLFSPYDVDALGLRYAADEQWFINGTDVLGHMAPGHVMDDAAGVTGAPSL